MCDPVTVIAVGSVLMSSISAIGQYQSATNQAKMQKKQADAQANRLDYEAKLNERNAKIVDMQQVQIADKAKKDKISLSQQISLLRGQGKSSFGASGVVLGTGSPLDWEVGIDKAEQYDRDIIDYNAAWDSWSLTNKAAGYRTQAGINSSEAESTRSFGKANYKSATQGATVGLLSGIGSSVAGGFGTYAKLGGTFGPAAANPSVQPAARTGYFGPGF